MSVLYVDELFCLNGAIDYFLLLATAKVCALPLRRGRFALGAVLGAAWCCVSLLPDFAWLSCAAMKTVLAAGMCLTAFGRDGKLWRSFGVFLAVSVLFGGAVWAAGLGRGMQQTDGRLLRLDMRVLALSFAVCWVGIGLLFRRAGRKTERALHDIALRHRGHCCSFRALRDTGNELHDPLTGRRVLVAEAGALDALFDPSERAAVRKNAVDAAGALRGFHLVPYRSLGGSGLLLCFQPEKLWVDGEGRDDLAVAISAQPLDPEGGYRAIL